MVKAMKKGLLIVMSGPSGVGKGTIRDILFENKKLDLFFSVSMTTRKPRPGEVDGVDYYFVSKEEFLKNVEEDNLLEWTEYVGNYYGTPKSKVEEMRNDGKNVLLEIDVNGASNVLSKVDDAVSIFIAPPSMEELERRIRHRGTESEETIQNRIERARKELKFEKQYKYVVINNERNEAVDEITELIKKQIKESLWLRLQFMV